MEDYELIELVHQNNEEAFEMLLHKYRPTMVKAIRRVKARTNYRNSSSDEDEEILQLCQMALLEAVNNFRDDGGASFSYYALTCIESAIRLYIRQHRTNRCQTTNLALSLDCYVKESDSIYMVDTIKNNHPEFEGVFYIEKCLNEYIWDCLKNKLTKKELQILLYRMEGYTYREIALILELKTKQVAYICDKIKKLLASYID